MSTANRFATPPVKGDFPLRRCLPKRKMPIIRPSAPLIGRHRRMRPSRSFYL